MIVIIEPQFLSTTKTLPLLHSLTSLAAIRPPFFCHMKTIEQKIEQRREWQKAARERAIARQREKLADPAWRESQYQKMRDTIDRRIAKQKERPPASKTRKSAVKIKSRGLKGRTPTAEEPAHRQCSWRSPLHCLLHAWSNI